MITVDEIKALVKELADTRNLLAELKKPVTAAELKKKDLQAKLAGMLKDLNEKSFECEFGRVTRVANFSVKLPDGERKMEFFEYLKSKGLFEAYATVNYASLNAFYKTERENAIAEAKKNGDAMGALNFSLPGIGEATVFEDIRFMKKGGVDSEE